MERELVKIASDNPAHPHGYYVQFKDRVKPGAVVYGIETTADSEVMPSDKESIKHDPASKPNRKVKR